MTASEPDELLRARADAVLVDVRTRPEWSYVGVPDLSGLAGQGLLVEWQRYPTTAVNQEFVPGLLNELSRRETSRKASILFLCRWGARS